MAVLGIARFLAGSNVGFAQQCGTLLKLQLPDDKAIRPSLVAMQQFVDARPLAALHAEFAKVAGRYPAFADLVMRLFAPDPSPSILISDRVRREAQETQEEGINYYGTRTPPRSGHLDRQFKEADGHSVKKPLRAGQSRTDR